MKETLTNHKTLSRDFVLAMVGNRIFTVDFIKKGDGSFRTMKAIRGAKKFASPTAKKPSDKQLTADIRHNNIKATELHPVTEEEISSWARTIPCSNLLRITANKITLTRRTLDDFFTEITD